ncbi:MAG TPA: NrfD/PsrC family molybdoenzyme membrane anchor subunit [Burkholderiales bacterium]|nr:NrfD/PsrC family molybdoenzyme membrane anchor subunit [Burkholderiales bacterium]
MASIALREIEGRSRGWWALFALGAALLLGMLLAWHAMESRGHVITGMTNQVVWGLPHVIAVFLILAASGVLNVASVASAFGKGFYKPLAPLSGWLALVLLAGGLAVLGLDLGRSDRLIVAMTHFNFKSIFAWNMFLYSGFFAIVGAYLWTMLERTAGRYSSAAGRTAFVWRLVLTTGTGSIFGFLVAREAYASALLAPMFIVLSIVYGTAIYLLALIGVCAGTGRALGRGVIERIGRLLGWFALAGLYFVAVFHLTNLYLAKQIGVERFLLVDGGIYTGLFWLGQVLLGSVVPLVMLWHPATRGRHAATAIAAALIVLGGLAQMYVTIIGAQAWPLDLFPGYQMHSSFYDGVIHPYAPSLPEAALALGGFAIALLGALLGVKFLRLLPESLSDAALEPGAGAH